jgi:hypothetical protein
MNKAKELFERYSAGGAAYIERISQEGIAETLHLDFKECRHRSPSDDLGYYSRALSSFANSEGGILVWGVVCKPTGNDDPDTTKEAIPIDGLVAFRNLLEGKTDEYLQPGINGVEHVLLPIEPAGDKGYVVTYIPRAEGPPQMSVAKNNRGFFCRIGSRTKSMEHYQIADRFRERPQPRLEVFLNAGVPNGLTTLVGDQQIDVCVRNVGAGIARGVALSVRANPTQFHAHSNITPKLNVFPVDVKIGWRTFALPSEEILYPGSYSKLVYFQWTFPLSDEQGPRFSSLELEYRAFCDGSFVDGVIRNEANKPI